MIRIYLDNNIFQIIKRDHPFFNGFLASTLDNFRGKLLFVFSDAHLEDLQHSRAEYRDTDLELIGSFTGDNYFAIDHKNTLHCYLEMPTGAYNKRNFETIDEFFRNPGRIDDIFNAFDDMPELKPLRAIFNNLLDLPLRSLNSIPDIEEMDKESQEMLRKHLPSYGPEMTIRQFWNDNLNFSTKFLFDKEEYTGIRRHVQKYLNRNDYSWDQWKMEFDQKLKETPIERSFTEMLDSMLVNDQKDDFYLKFLYGYILLESFNITQERTKKGLKKFTMDSLMRDARHAYFASLTDYQVTDDRGLQVKSYILYELFGLRTRVLSVDDCISLGQVVLQQEEELATFKKHLLYDLENAELLIKKSDQEDNGRVETFITSHIYFNYFNRLQKVHRNGASSYVLYCERRFSFANFAMYRELELLTEKLLRAFGPDDEQKGNYDISERANEEHLRVWTLNGVRFELLTSDRENSEYICLYFFIDHQESIPL